MKVGDGEVGTIPTSKEAKPTADSGLGLTANKSGAHRYSQSDKGRSYQSRDLLRIQTLASLSLHLIAKYIQVLLAEIVQPVHLGAKAASILARVNQLGLQSVNLSCFVVDITTFTSDARK
jgi:hypothetical protein